MNKLIIVAICAAAAGGGSLFVWKPWQGSSAAKGSGRDVHTVARQDLKISLVERGTLKTKKSTKMLCETYAKIEWLIDEGAKVKKDDVLVRLDRKEAQQRYEQLQSQVTQVKTELKTAETNEQIEKDQAQTNIEKAERALEKARIEHKKLMEADLPKEERDLKLKVEEAEIDVERKKDQFEARKELRKEEFVTENDVKDAEIAYKKAINQRETARMAWTNFEKYDRPMKIKEKDAAVVEAERGLERAKKKSAASLSAKSAQVQQKKVQLKRLDIQLKRVKEQLEKMVIKAPSDGTVIYGSQDNPWETQRVKVGQQVWQGMCLITLPDPTEMAVILQIHEADIDKIKKGMKAFVTSETQKDRTYDGSVTKIGNVANAGRRGGGGGVKKFKVEVDLEGKHLPLKPGTSASAELHIDEIKDVIVVPVQAIHAKEGKFYCYTPEQKRVEVEPGRNNNKYVEIKSGLKEGDKVLLVDPKEEKKKDDGDDEGDDSP